VLDDGCPGEWELGFCAGYLQLFHVMSVLIQGIHSGKDEDFLSDQYFSLMCITAMDTAEVDLPESTGVELDFLQPKKKMKKKGSKSNGLQIQGYMS
jgi:hypothetical protein